jgi:predicted RNA-binding Zn-ribbon protein involved in translation (DUF1610 family)
MTQEHVHLSRIECPICGETNPQNGGTDRQCTSCGGKFAVRKAMLPVWATRAVAYPRHEERGASREN